MRKDARDAVYKILYAKLFNEVDGEFIAETYADLKLSKADAEFSDSLLRIITEHFDEITAEIDRLAVGYSYERLYSTVKCALCLAFAEMKYTEVPKIVAIDEAMTLLRRYSDKDGMNFANGVLAAYKVELESADANN